MTVPPGSDIYRFAHVLLRKHRGAACLEALRHADRRLRHGDLNGFMVWRQIGRATEHIQRMERKTDMAA